MSPDTTKVIAEQWRQGNVANIDREVISDDRVQRRVPEPEQAMVDAMGSLPTFRGTPSMHTRRCYQDALRAAVAAASDEWVMELKKKAGEGAK